MLTQKFKGDAVELQMEAAAKPAFDLCSLALDNYFAQGHTANDFLLMLYDSGRMPFTERVPRDSFAAFIREAIPSFPMTGTFESYLLIVASVFGLGSQIIFNVPAAGKIEMLVNAATSLEFDFQIREYVDGAYVFYNIVTMAGDSIKFRGLSGIQSEAQLTELLNELIPAGVFPDITLAFFAIYYFLADDGSSMVDYLGNELIFYEAGSP